jgi:hypothetical protein
VNRLILLLAIPCCAEPKWVSIATPSEPFQYFRFSASGTIERDRFEPSNPHPQNSFTYKFHKAPAPQRTTCRLEDRPADHVFWYSSNGKHLAGSFVTPQPSEFNVSARQPGMRGFAVTASFNGSANTAGDAMEVVYFTDRACSDGGVEYGFARDLATNNLLVYWSTYANCGNDAASLCRKTNDPSLGEQYSNVQQESERATAQHGFRIYGLAVNAEYTYRMFAERDSFRVEVFNGNGLAQCSETEYGPRQSCSFAKPVENWFPIRQLNGGYIVAGTLGTATDDAALRVTDILVTK